MKTGFAQSFFLWFSWAIWVAPLTMAQTLFLSQGGPYNAVPYLSFPLLIFCFLHKRAGFSLLLALFFGFVFSGFSYLSAPVLMIVFIFWFLFVVFVKAVALPRPGPLYFSLVFLLSLSFPYLMDFGFDFKISDTSLYQAGLYFLKSFATLALSVPFWFFLKQRLKKQAPASF